MNVNQEYCMCKRYLIFCLAFLFSAMCWAQGPTTNHSHKSSGKGNEMVPWYTGPLLTPSAHNVEPGEFLVQPYLSIKSTYGTFNQKRHYQKAPNRMLTVQPQILCQMGLLSWLDVSIIPTGTYNSMNKQHAFNMGDTDLALGIKLMKEDSHKPNLRFSVTEKFPTGKYKKLNPKKLGVDATGKGCYTTNLDLNASKVFHFFEDHPFRIRGSVGYDIPTKAHVKGYNTYGAKTEGKVSVGRAFDVSSSVEFSLTQQFVLALDLLYRHQKSSKFHDKATGTTTDSTPSNDSFSLAPAIEYNVSENLGFILGAWVTVTGRNSDAFVSSMLSMCYSF